MVVVEGLAPADRESDPVDRQGVTGPDLLEIPMRRPAVSHVVLGVDLEKADPRRGPEDLRAVLRLQTQSGPRRKPRTDVPYVKM
jgi:hypothetical protein